MKSYDVTSEGVSPEEDRARRMRFYTIAMSIRIACVASLFFVRGWWVLLVALAAVFLPYIAVVIANEPNNSAMKRPEAVPPLMLEGPATQVESSEAPPLIVVDDPAERRASAPDSSPEAGAP